MSRADLIVMSLRILLSAILLGNHLDASDYFAIISGIQLPCDFSAQGSRHTQRRSGDRIHWEKTLDDGGAYCRKEFRWWAGNPDGIEL